MNASNATFSQCCHGKDDFHLRQIKEAIDLLHAPAGSLAKVACVAG